MTTRHIHTALGWLAAVMVAAVPPCPPEISTRTTSETSGQAAAASFESFIVQADCAQTARRLVEGVGGTVTHQLAIIDAVGATLSPRQLATLTQRHRPARVWQDRSARVTANGSGGGNSQFGTPPSAAPRLVGADRLHAEGITGAGVTVAVVDTGTWDHRSIRDDSTGRDRVLAIYDATVGDFSSTDSDDRSGHGTHVISVMMDNSRDDFGEFISIAPDVDYVSVRAFGEDGSGTYADVIRGLDWILQNKDPFGIDVVNLSFSAEPRSYYWDDPLNQAVMRLWQHGIVVVASAGNRGPDALTIGVPGNVPYVITVGAVGDWQMPVTDTNEFLGVFSSAGPTVEGFVKPELIAPGGKVLGVMSFRGHQIAKDHPEFAFNKRFFQMSGTSQAAAVVTGAVALLLQAEPTLTPDEVKYRLMSSARPAVNVDGSLAYSVFQQGAGLLHAYDSVHSTASGLANRGLDVTADLTGAQHFGGPANAYLNANGDYVYYVTDGLGNLLGDGYLWADGYLFADGFLWADGYLWAEGFLWADGYLFADGYLWSDGFLWADGYLWSDALTETMGINTWIDQQ